MGRLVVTEYVVGTQTDMIADNVKWPELSPDVYYPTIQQPDHDEPMTEAEFKGYPVEEVRVWINGKIITKHLVIVNEFAYDLE